MPSRGKQTTTSIQAVLLEGVTNSLLTISTMAAIQTTNRQDPSSIHMTMNFASDCNVFSRFLVVICCCFLACAVRLCCARSAWWTAARCSCPAEGLICRYIPTLAWGVVFPDCTLGSAESFSRYFSGTEEELSVKLIPFASSHLYTSADARGVIISTI